MKPAILPSTLLGSAMLLPGCLPAAEPPPGYDLVWSDEFDQDGPPDPSRWDYEEGFVRNNEAQYYTRQRRENARVEQGLLVIEARKEPFANPRYDPNATGPRNRPQADYTSASLKTQGKASWQFGRIEVRAKLPSGKGVWPAIWMLGDSISRIGWPACGEIDIMEFVGHTPDKVHATVHWRKEGKHASQGGALTVAETWRDFHVYAVEWTPERMDFYFDQTSYRSFEIPAADDQGQNAFRLRHYLIINLALGGSWGREIDDSIFPQQFLIDYVRVYQRR